MPRQSMRLLVVDDSPADAELLRFEFEREGCNPISCRVETESDLRDALHAAESNMVIADDSMPHLSSMQALCMKSKCRPCRHLLFCAP